MQNVHLPVHLIKLNIMRHRSASCGESIVWLSKGPSFPTKDLNCKLDFYFWRILVRNLYIYIAFFIIETLPCLVQLQARRHFQSWLSVILWNLKYHCNHNFKSKRRRKWGWLNTRRFNRTFSPKAQIINKKQLATEIKSERKTPHRYLWMRREEDLKIHFEQIRLFAQCSQERARKGEKKRNVSNIDEKGLT